MPDHCSGTGEGAVLAPLLLSPCPAWLFVPGRHCGVHPRRGDAGSPGRGCALSRCFPRAVSGAWGALGRCVGPWPVSSPLLPAHHFLSPLSQAQEKQSGGGSSGSGSRPFPSDALCYRCRFIITARGRSLPPASRLPRAGAGRAPRLCSSLASLPAWHPTSPAPDYLSGKQQPLCGGKGGEV